MKSIGKFLIVAACSGLGACAHLGTTADDASSAQLVSRHYGEEDLQAVLWMQTAVEFRAVAQGAYASAKRSLDLGLSDPSWNAVVDAAPAAPDARPAVIIDLDETSVDNSVYQAQLLRDEQVHSDARFGDFIRSGRVAAVPGALDFLQYAASRGVAIFYITNQDHSLEEATRTNLRKLAFPLDTTEDPVLTVGEKPEWMTSDKAPRRSFVAAHYRVVLLLGDDFNDFVSASGKSLEERRALYDRYANLFGIRWFMIPNPAYGSWERAVVGKEAKTPDQSFAAKMRALRLTAAQ